MRGRDAHEVGIDAAAASGNQDRMGLHGVPHAGQSGRKRHRQCLCALPGRLVPRGGLVLVVHFVFQLLLVFLQTRDPLAGRGQPRHRQREGSQRQMVRRRAAAIHAEFDLFRLEPREEGEQPADRHLHSMLGVKVVLERQPEVPRGRQHGEMLARAVVLKHRRAAALFVESAPHLRVEGGVQAALQLLGRETGLLQQALDQLDMAGFTAVGSADHGQFLVRDREGVGGARTDEGERLERFGRGPGEELVFRLAEGSDKVSAGIDDGDDAAMQRLEPTPSRDLDHRLRGVLGRHRSPFFRAFPGRSSSGPHRS